MEQGTTLAPSLDSAHGGFSVQMNTTDSYDVYLRQEIWVDESVCRSVILGFVFRIDEIDDIDSNGQHSLTGLEIGLEGGDVDWDGQPEYMYHYFFTDECVRAEDFPAWQYNTTPTDAPHKMAFLHRVDSVGVWNSFECNISHLFLENLGGFPRGAIDLRVWAFRWGDGKPDSGIRATIDSVGIWVPEGTAIAILVLGAMAGASHRLLDKACAGQSAQPADCHEAPTTARAEHDLK